LYKIKGCSIFAFIKSKAMTNKYSAIILIAALLFTSCKKDDVKPSSIPTDPSPEMVYKNLGEKEIKYAQPSIVIDLDSDNQADLIFGVLLVGDPVEQLDKRQFRVTSGINTNLPVNASEQVPAMIKDETIPISDFNGYNWFKVSSIILVQRVEDINGGISWNGNWKGAIKKYLPFQLLKNDQRFNGWIEISADVVNEKVVLHRLAISKVAEKEIKAG
jgi:hypothetical protein